jgi:catechol 2,3-dioxygenase-like lactoylglutathione lyase family enzyme
MQNAIPALRMTNYEQTKRFYTEGMGFKVDWEHRYKPNFPVFMQVSRDEMILYLSEHRGDCQPGGLVHFFVADVDAWYQELRQRLPKACAGLSEIQAPPSEAIPGLRDMTVLDPDGNKLRICTRVEQPDIEQRRQDSGYTVP